MHSVKYYFIKYIQNICKYSAAKQYSHYNYSKIYAHTFSKVQNKKTEYLTRKHVNTAVLQPNKPSVEQWSYW